MDKLRSCLPNYIVDKIISILIHINDISDKLIWKFSSHDIFSAKTTMWANNDQFPSHPRRNLLNIWKLKLIHKLRLFAWKLIRGKISTNIILEKLVWILMVTVRFTVIM